ncbi:MAG TPA: site-2 protease family protein [Ruminococcaceae bacterium]|jgi:Zn-dependent protease|nr:site-2 protease family protein [Oscillospiraceae bacterium]
MLFSIIQDIVNGVPVKPVNVIADILAMLFIIFCILPIHEWAHAWTANKLGDNTAKLQGRMSLNPLVSFDPIGSLFLLLFGFGWAKPVPIEPRNFRNTKRDTALTSLAGPLSNFIVAWIGALVVYGVKVATGGAVPDFLYYFLMAYIEVNVSLAIFNLIPLPPLDGSKILGAFLSDRALYNYYRYQNIIVIIAFFVLISNVLSKPLTWLTLAGCNGVLWLGRLPYVLLGLL